MSLYSTERACVEVCPTLARKLTTHQKMCVEYLAYHVPLRDGHRRYLFMQKSDMGYPRLYIVEAVSYPDGTGAYDQPGYIGPRGISWSATGKWRDMCLAATKKDGRLTTTGAGRALGWADNDKED